MEPTITLEGRKFLLKIKSNQDEIIVVLKDIHDINAEYEFKYYLNEEPIDQQTALRRSIKRVKEILAEQV